jgi:hypothetical protein
MDFMPSPEPLAKGRFSAGESWLSGIFFKTAFHFLLPLAVLAALSWLPTAQGQDIVFRLPPVKSSIRIENQPVAIVASGMISRVSGNRNENVFQLELHADLSDLQENLTDILRSELDKSERCGERIAMQHAALMPSDPSGVVIAQLHFERWACTKVFGKQVPNKLVGGNAKIQAKLTPQVDGNSVRLVPELGTIEADGALGALLRSGEFGAKLREKIRVALLSAMQKGTDFSATLPPAIQGLVSIESVKFEDAGSGRLALTVEAELRISKEQLSLLARQLKDRASSPDRVN